MPTYEYKREDGTTFEYFQGINDAALETCPTTGLAVKRIISGGGGVIYKGSGFYVTDYKNNSNGNGAGKDNGSSKNGNQAESPKSENKSAEEKPAK